MGIKDPKGQTESKLANLLAWLWGTRFIRIGLIAFVAIVLAFSVYSLFLGGDEELHVDEASEVVVPEPEPEVAPDSM